MRRSQTLIVPRSLLPSRIASCFEHGCESVACHIVAYLTSLRPSGLRPASFEQFHFTTYGSPLFRQPASSAWHLSAAAITLNTDRIVPRPKIVRMRPDNTWSRVLPSRDQTCLVRNRRPIANSSRPTTARSMIGRSSTTNGSATATPKSLLAIACINCRHRSTEASGRSDSRSVPERGHIDIARTYGRIPGGRVIGTGVLDVEIGESAAVSVLFCIQLPMWAHLSAFFLLVRYHRTADE